MTSELLRRAFDLSHQAEKYASPTNSCFLTPAEQQILRSNTSQSTVVFHGGGEDCDRKCAFFLPSWLEPEDLDPGTVISALRISSPFGNPNHRDYLGSILGLGVKRECLGDIRIFDNIAYLYCLQNIADFLSLNLEKVGRNSVKTAIIPLSEVPALNRRYKSVVFSVSSLRLDSICSGMFGLSRSAANAQILQGNVTVNYFPCTKPDYFLHLEDIISLRGRGKGTFAELQGTSRKGRLRVRVEIWE